MGGFQRTCDSHLGNQITCLCSQDVGSQEFISVSIKNYFDESLTAANGQGFAAGAKGKTAHTHGPPRLPRRLFSHSHTRHLRLAIGAARNIVVVHAGIIEPSNGFDSGNAFGGGHVRQARRTIDIANSVNARYVRPAVRIDGDKAALTVYARRLKPEVLDVPMHPDGHEHACALHSARTLGRKHLYLYAIGRDLCTLYPAAHMDRDALLFERFL